MSHPPKPDLAGPARNEESVVHNVMEVKHLRVAYSGREAVHGVQLPIARGVVTAMVGPSGCGKTTLLRTLNRLSEMTPGCRVTGDIRLDGEDCLAMDPVELRRRVGMVFQRPNLFPMSIRENVLYGVKAQGTVPKDQWDRILEESLRQAVIWDEVKDRLNDSALSLSGGQQQRVCIARSLAVSPEIVLMDEPAGSLDPRSTAKLEESILAMRGAYTVVVVTHELGQAHRISDYLAFMYAGHIIEFGPTNALFDNPREASTREYLAGGLVTLAGEEVEELAEAGVA